MGKKWTGIDMSGKPVEHHWTRRAADRAADTLNGPTYPGVDAKYDYKHVNDIAKETKP
jgi:hypothetical protein